MAKFFVASTFLISLISILNDLYPETLANKCDEEIFYLPYVYVKKKKNGGDIAALKSTGFLDLRFRSRVVLCINGPVVLYGDVERLDPDAKLTAKSDRSKDSLKGTNDARFPSPDHDLNEYEFVPGEELRFKKGELMVFNHQCISINKVPSNVLKKMKEDQGRSNPEIMPDTQVTGKLVLGVFLIANKDGHNNPEMAWFKGTNYDYIKSADKSVKDSSFIVSGSNVTHCMRLPDGTHIKITAAPGRETNSSHEVCRWTVKEEDKHWYAKLFQRGYDGNGVRNGDPTLSESDYEIYDCPDSDPDRNIILTMSKTTPEPISHVNYTEFDPFSLFNPNLWTPHGFRRDSNGISGGDERGEDKAMNMNGADGVPCSLDPANPGCMDGEDMEMTTLKDMQNVDPISSNSYEIFVDNCISLPVFDINDCTGIGDNGNRLLELVLELEPAYKCEGGEGQEGEAPPASPAAEGEGAGGSAKQHWPKCKNLDDDDDLNWKMDILCLVSDIFQHLCMPFRPEMPFTVARVFGWYIYKAHIYGENMGRVGPPPAGNSTPAVSAQFDRLIEKTDTWMILEKELERCRTVAKQENGGKGLKFMWEVGDETGKWKIPAIDGRPTRRRKRSVTRKYQPLQPEYPTYQKRSKRSLQLHKEFQRKLKEDEADEFEIIEEIDAATGVKTLHPQKRSNAGHRQKRALNKSALFISGISKKYILPGKSLTPVESEGTLGYVREVIQEYRPKPDLNDPRADSSKYMDYPENVHHCWNPQEDPITKQVVCAKTEEIFFYEDKAEMEYELNIAIDIWWKIWATVIGYCNKAYHSRKSETFPRLYNSKYEYFFDLIQKEWKWPEDNEDLKVIFSEYLTEESHIWMDTCLESAYINSNSHSYRPPRPMTIVEDKKEVSNYFEEVPSYIYYRYHPEPSGAM